jgi:3-isopropylmalate/(R)-2-methylmalate dehydratase small subunit
MAGLKKLTSRVVVLAVNDIDTDQLIPARFLKVTTKVGLGAKLFNDWRYLPDGSPNPAFVLNQPAAQGCQVLLAGDNFGCGSSREHAPWALKDWGFLAVVATSFADIFKSNALKNGVLPVVVDAATHARLQAQLAADPAAVVSVDLERTALTLPDGAQATFPIDPFSRKCLLEGVDELGYLQSKAERIAAFEAARGGASGTP